MIEIELITIINVIIIIDTQNVINVIHQPVHSPTIIDAYIDINYL